MVSFTEYGLGLMITPFGFINEALFNGEDTKVRKKRERAVAGLGEYCFMMNSFCWYKIASGRVAGKEVKYVFLKTGVFAGPGRRRVFVPDLLTVRIIINMNIFYTHFLLS